MDKKLKMPSLIVLGGCLFSLVYYFIWYFQFFHKRLNRDDCFLTYVAVVSAIAAVYFIIFLLILYIESVQKFWTSFSLVSIITLLFFFLTPTVIKKIYYMSYFNKLNLDRYITVKTIDKTEPEKKILSANKKEIKIQPEDDKEKIQRKKTSKRNRIQIN